MKNKSKFAQHLLENEHHIGPMENAMDIIYKTGKGRMLDTLEKFYIYRETKRNNQINGKLTAKPNVIFDVLVHKDPHRVHAFPQ
jgi:hypothetical protein